MLSSMQELEYSTQKGNTDGSMPMCLTKKLRKSPAAVQVELHLPDDPNAFRS